MINEDFKIDFKTRRIAYRPPIRQAQGKKGSGTVYTVSELYSFLQDTFDEPENMKYEVPIEAKSKTKYFLINGWSIDEEGRKHLKEGKLD